MSIIKVDPVSDGSSRPIWSVMIPTYNCARYLKKTLESVLSQDRGDNLMEIWVVDDHSTQDDPRAVVEKLGKGRVRFYQQPKNVGQLNNFETCLQLSRGRIIHLLHGDDYIHPGFYAKLEAPMLEESSIGAAFSRHQFVDEDGNLLSTSEELGHTAGLLPDFVSSIASRQLIQTPSIVVKREVYEQIGGFNKSLKWCEDWEMWIRIACRYNFYYEPSVLASYRVHKTSNTGESTKTGRFIDDVLACLDIYLAYLPILGQERRIIIKNAKAHTLNFALSVSKDFHNQHDIQSALTVLYKSLKLTHSFRSFATIMKRILAVKTGR